MNTIFTVIIVVQVISALTIIGLVLLQHGKGADMGAAFGSGASGSLFGATGSANFLSRSTAVAATIFFITSMSLTYMYANPARSQGVMDRQTVVQPVQVAPAPAGSDANGSKSQEIPK